MAEGAEQGITRRELLKRGGALGGAVVWATPVVQTLGMGRAFAQTASPIATGISYIALNISCAGDVYFIKWEEGESDPWEVSPGNAPGCPLEPAVLKAKGSDFGFTVLINPDGSATVNWTSNCVVTEAAVKGGEECDHYPSGISNGATLPSPI